MPHKVVLYKLPSEPSGSLIDLMDGHGRLRGNVDHAPVTGAYEACFRLFRQAAQAPEGAVMGGN
jgi:hypothetical protein